MWWHHIEWWHLVLAVAGWMAALGLVDWLTRATRRPHISRCVLRERADKKGRAA